MLQYVPTPPYLGSSYPNMIPTIGGGYGYYSPQYYQQQQEEAEKQRKAHIENQLAVWKQLTVSVNNYYGIETDEAVLNEYFSPDRIYAIRDDYSQIDQLASLKEQDNQERAWIDQKIREREEEIQNAPKNDESLLDFLRGTATDTKINMLERRAYKASHNVAALYDSNGFKRLLGIHEGSAFNSLMPNVNVDDIEIGLPPHLMSSETELRRKRFMESILATEKRW